MGFVALGIVVLLFLALFEWDRRAKKKGHRLRRAAEIHRSELDVRRSVRASEATTVTGPIDADWSKPDDQRAQGSPPN